MFPKACSFASRNLLINSIADSRNKIFLKVSVKAQICYLMSEVHPNHNNILKSLKLIVVMTTSKLLLSSANTLFEILTSTSFRMCLLMTVGSGFGTTPDAHSNGSTGLLGVVGEVGC